MAYDVARKRKVEGDWSCGIGDDVGSFVFPVKEQQALYNKIDDVRYDMRKAGALVGAGLAALGGAVAMLGLAQMWNVARGRA